MATQSSLSLSLSLSQLDRISLAYYVFFLFVCLFIHIFFTSFSFTFLNKSKTLCALMNNLYALTYITTVQQSYTVSLCVLSLSLSTFIIFQNHRLFIFFLFYFSIQFFNNTKYCTLMNIVQYACYYSNRITKVAFFLFFS